MQTEDKILLTMDDFWTDELVEDYAKRKVISHISKNSGGKMLTIEEFKLSKMRTPLLTTVDGAEIFDENLKLFTLSIFRWTTSERLAKNATHTPRLLFSTLEARDEYILEHKPQFSLKQIKENIIDGKFHIGKLKQSVKK